MTEKTQKKIMFAGIIASSIGIGSVIRDMIQYVKDQRLERKMDDLKSLTRYSYKEWDCKQDELYQQILEVRRQNNELLAKVLQQNQEGS